MIRNETEYQEASVRLAAERNRVVSENWILLRAHVVRPVSV